MARIKLNDLTQDAQISPDDMKKVFGGAGVTGLNPVVMPGAVNINPGVIGFNKNDEDCDCLRDCPRQCECNECAPECAECIRPQRLELDTLRMSGLTNLVSKTTTINDISKTI